MGKKWRIKRKTVFVLLLAVLLLATGFLIIPETVKASGFVDFVQDATYRYSSYSLENYDLDFYVDMSWTWLPWNWTDGIGRSIMYGVYCFTNALWTLSRYISFATGEIVTEAYRLDLISELSDTIGANLQKLAGVSPSGFSAEGFYPGFIMLIIAVTGGYTAYVGLIKREFSKALSAVINMLIIFICSTAFIAYAPTCIKSINDFSADISTGALKLGIGLTMPGAASGEDGSVDLIRDNLFNVQIYQPWLLMQYGTTDVSGVIGEDRVNRLLSVSPEEAYGETREAVVKDEIENHNNTRMTTTKVAARFGEVLLIFIVNLAISIFVTLLSGLMIFSQILFIIYVLFLAVSFVISMFPTFNGLAKKSLMKVFNVILQRTGYVLIITITFMISTMVYSISGNHSFVVIGLLQIIVYAGVFLNLGDILQFMSVQQDRGMNKLGLLGGALVYRKMRRSGARHERRAEERKEKVKRAAAGAVTGAAGWAHNKIDQKAGEAMRQQFAQDRQRRAEKRARQKNRFDYTASKDTPKTSGADFHGTSSSQLLNKYLNRVHGRDFGRVRDGRYKPAKNAPKVNEFGFESGVQNEDIKKFRRPELWKDRVTGKNLRDKYQGNVIKNKADGAVKGASVETDAHSGRRYYAAEKRKVPKADHIQRGGKHSPVNQQLKNKITMSRRMNHAYEKAETSERDSISTGAEQYRGTAMKPEQQRSIAARSEQQRGITPRSEQQRGTTARIEQQGGTVARPGQQRDTAIRPGQMGTAGNNMERQASLSAVRNMRQEDTYMSKGKTESSNWKRESVNWRAGGNGRPSPQENSSRRNRKSGKRGTGNWRGQ